MKKYLIISGLIALAACDKKVDSVQSSKTNASTIQDSVNAAVAKHNDSITALNNKNRFADMSGKHSFTYSTQGADKLSGNIDFTKVGRDEYEVVGTASTGSNSIKIKGSVKKVSEKFLSFNGEIQQSIDVNNNGKIYTRKGKQTFAKKGNVYRLQDMVNDAGFVDYIDISSN